MDLDIYYREQDERMNMPDEDIDDYLGRIGVHRSSRSIFHEQKIKEQDYPQTQGERGNDFEHVSSMSGKMHGIATYKNTADNLSQRPHGGAANVNTRYDAWAVLLSADLKGCGISITNPTNRVVSGSIK